MKVTGYVAEANSHVVYQRNSDDSHEIIKNRWDSKSDSVAEALSWEFIRVSVVDQRHKVIVVNKALQEHLKRSGFDVPNEITVVNIGVNGKNVFIGYFLDINDAIKARKQAEVEYHGEYADKRGTA